MRKPVSSVTAPIVSPVLGERPRTPQHPMRRFFRNDEVGVWYDPSDLSALFQDSAGSIPVTGPDQPIGLMLDKSQGLVFGGNQWSNQNFTVANNAVVNTIISGERWSVLTASGSPSNFSQGARIFSISPALTAGLWYEFSVDATNAINLAVYDDVFIEVARASSSNKILFKAGASGVHRLYVCPRDTSELEFFSPVVRTLPGHHAWQDAAASKPVLRESGGLYWLECDGVDDFMQTAPIPWASDKLLAVVGVRKMSDAAHGVVAELTENSSTAGNAFALFAPIIGESSYTFRSSGSAAYVNANAAPSAYPAPDKAVLTGVGDIGGDSAVLRVNGTQAGSSTVNQGTGNYATAPLYLFSRSGTSLFFNGHFYGMTLAGSQYPPALVESSERYLASKIGLSL